MNKKNMRRVSMLVTAQTAKNLDRLAAMSGYYEVGRVVDKLVREKMISLRFEEGALTMLFEECGHYSGECPCLTCNEECAACQVAPDGYAVDTDRLCKRAREYCESGRKDSHDDGV